MQPGIESFSLCPRFGFLGKNGEALLTWDDGSTTIRWISCDFSWQAYIYSLFYGFRLSS